MGILSGVRDAVGGATDFLNEKADQADDVVDDAADSATSAVGGAVEDATEPVEDAVRDVATDEELQEQFDGDEGVTDLGNLGAGFKATAELALDKTGVQDALTEVAKKPTEIATGEEITDEELANATEDVYGEAEKGAYAVSEAIGENVGPNSEAFADFVGEAFVADPIEGASIAATGVDPATGEDDAYLSAEKAVDPLIFAGTGTLKAGKVGAKGAAKLSETGATNMGFVSGATKLTDELFGVADDTFDEGAGAVDDAVDAGGSGTGLTDEATDVFDDTGDVVPAVDEGTSGLDDAETEVIDEVGSDEVFDAGSGADDFSGMDSDEFARVVEDADGPSDEFAGFGDVADDAGSGADEFGSVGDDVGGSTFDDFGNTASFGDDFSSTADETASGVDETVQGADEAASGADDAATGADDGFNIGTGTKVFGGIGVGALGTAGAIDFLGGGLADNDDDRPDPDEPTGNGAGEEGWGEPQQVDQGRGWTVYAQKHSDGRTRYYAVRDNGSTYLQPEGETGSEPHYFSSEQALAEAFKAWARKQQSGEGSSGSESGSGSSSGGGSGSGSEDGGWSEPKKIQTVQGWHIYGQTHSSKGERYFAVGKREDGGKIYLQPEGETSTSIHYFDSAEALKQALKKWAQRREEEGTRGGSGGSGGSGGVREPTGGQPKNPTKDRGGWSEMKHVRELPLGWHLFGQTHPKKGKRYVIAGKTNGNRIYLAEDGTVANEPVYYKDISAIKEALKAYASRVENGEASTRPSGGKPDPEKVTEEATESSSSVSGFLSDLSTTQKVVGAVAVAGAGYYAYEEGYFDDVGGEV